MTSTYQQPTAPDLIVPTDKLSQDQCLQQVIAWLDQSNVAASSESLG